MIRIDIPEPGHYKTKLVKGGPWVAARIWEDREELLCLVGTRLRNVFEWWPRLAGHPITPEEWDAMMVKASWARHNAPWLPEANPGRPINLDNVPIPKGGAE